MAVKSKPLIDLRHIYDPGRNKQQWLAHQVEERYVLYGGAYGGGKTAWLINEVIRLCVVFPGNRAFLGCRDGTDFKRNAYGQLLKFLPAAWYGEKILVKGKWEKMGHGLHHQSDQFFQLINGSIIYYGGLGNEADAIKKISNMPELGVVAIDQAEEITENQFLLLDGRLRLNLPGIRYKLLLTANPDPGWLRSRFIAESKPNHRYIPAMPQDNPFLAENYVETLKENYEPEMIRRLLEGDWDIPGVNFMFPYQGIRDAINRDMPQAGIKVAGVDVARYGNDKTVFIVRQGNKVLHIESWSHQDTVFSTGKVAELIREWKPLVTNIDSIGIGVGVFDPLRSEGYNVREINVAEKALKEEIYVNLRAELYSKLAKRFEMGEIDIPDNRKLASELASIKYKYKGTKLLIESKEVMRRDGVASPDFADALMLAFIDSGVKREMSIYVRGVKVA